MPAEIGEFLRGDLPARQAGFLHPQFRPDVLFEHGEFGLDAAAFANIGIFRQAVLGADNVRAQAQAGPAGAAVRTRRFGLEPGQQRPA
jgi:hypothetical protein